MINYKTKLLQEVTWSIWCTVLLDRWWAEKNHSLNAHILPVPVQTVLEDVDRPSINLIITRSAILVFSTAVGGFGACIGRRIKICIV